MYKISFAINAPAGYGGLHVFRTLSEMCAFMHRAAMSVPNIYDFIVSEKAENFNRNLALIDTIAGAVFREVHSKNDLTGQVAYIGAWTRRGIHWLRLQMIADFDYDVMKMSVKNRALCIYWQERDPINVRQKSRTGAL